MRNVYEPYLPPDREAFLQADPATGRVLVIAPTRAACETIELALGLHIETFLEKHHGERVRELARGGKGFGIVAGTGTGKTLAIRPIAEEILGTEELKVGVVNREREATPETPSWNVIVITTGIARRWFEEDEISPRDTIVVDEIHQTSAELELCLALGKRAGCRFVWLSATVDPTFYSQYLDSADVLQVHAFDPDKAAKVKVIDKQPLSFVDDRFLQGLVKERRGVACFVPTRKGVEEIAEHVSRSAPRINTAFYHGGEPIRILRPFLEGGERKPYFLAMTAAGQSALNVHGLDTVIIDDKRFFTIVDRGRNVLTQEHLGANEILQMAGRVHGRVEGGRVFILSDRDIDFSTLKPTAPEFQLAGDSERVAITCAALGVRADELELPVPLDKVAYRRAMALLESRGIVENQRLTRYGRSVEAMPVDRHWAELLVLADDDLIPFLAVMASIDSLHRMLREEHDIDGLIIPGSDHLTAYNLYAEAYHSAGRMGEVYGLPRHLFDEQRVDEWAERRGVLVKTIEDAALGMASIYRSVGLQLPDTMPNAGGDVLRRFQALLAQYMPFQLVMDEQTADGQEARVSRSSVCGSWGAVAGELRYFADKFGTPRASIEGTQIPMDLIRRFATQGEPELVYDPERRRTPMVLRRRVEYYGFELEKDIEPIEEIPTELLGKARRVLAESLARQEARHLAVKKNRPAIEEIREVYRRSGGETPRLGQQELAEWYEKRLAEQGVDSLERFRAARLDMEADEIVPAAVRERWMSLPDTIDVRDREVAIEYDVEETPEGKQPVARLRLPEKVARTLTESELPVLDRPLRFVVTRGARGAARGATLEALQEELDKPWSEEELELANRQWEQRRAERKAARASVRQGRGGGDRGGRGEGVRGDGGGRGRGRGPQRDGRERFQADPPPPLRDDPAEGRRRGDRRASGAELGEPLRDDREGERRRPGARPASAKRGRAGSGGRGSAGGGRKKEGPGGPGGIGKGRRRRPK